LPDRCSSEIVNPSDTFLELMMLTPLKDGRQVSRSTSENVARQKAAHGNSVKVACPATESMPVENLDSRFDQQASRQRTGTGGRVSPPIPPPAFCAWPGGPSQNEATQLQHAKAANGARSVPRLHNTPPLNSPRKESAKSQWASKLAPVIETPVASRASFRPPGRSPQAATREVMGSRSATPGPSFRPTRGMTNAAPHQQQMQQQQQPPPPQQHPNHSMRSRSYQPPRPLEQCPSRSYGGVPRVNPPAGLAQAPPAPPAPPCRSPTPGRGCASPPAKRSGASPPLGRNSPQTRGSQELPCKQGGPQWGRAASPNPMRGANYMAAACSKSLDKRELMIAAAELEDEAGSGIVVPRTMSRLTDDSSASETSGWRPRRGGSVHSCCC
jgi:hypothetical protein